MTSKSITLSIIYYKIKLYNLTLSSFFNKEFIENYKTSDFLYLQQMNMQQKIGDDGEALAVKYLQKLNYTIIETNWRYSKSEIDIIAYDGDILVFVEVKTRSYDYYGQPEDSIDAKKELMIAEGAAAYMRFSGHNWAIRFDIISIILPKSGTPNITHYKDAFFPGLS